MISRFFIDRPIFASVLSIVIVILGVVALSQLPIAQYPDVALPTVQVTATYPGAEFQEGQVAVFGAPPVEGLGSTGGFKLQIQDRRRAGLPSLQGAVQSLADEARTQPELVGMFSSFSVAQPQLYTAND